MKTSRRFASLALILVIIIGLAVLGGAGWYAARPVSNSQLRQPPSTAASTTALGTAVSTASTATSSEPTTHGDFGAPERVTIQGYTGTAQDPWVTSDGKYLLFDTHADTSPDPSSSHPGEARYAKAIDYKTFTYVGRIQGMAAGDPTGQAAPVTDNAGNIYYLTGRYHDSQGISIAQGTFTDGVVTNIAPIKGISFPGGFNMSFSPSRDGKYMVFSDNGKASTLAIAKKNADGTFARLTNSAEIMKNITDQFSVAFAPQISNDYLELFFTAPPETTFLPQRSSEKIAIWVARRSSPTEPFGIAQPITTHGPNDPIDSGPTESGGLSPDGKHLYFHNFANGGVIMVVSRQ
jgi:hypothetical protein